MRKEKVSREEKMSQIQEKLEKGVREIFDSEKYREYIVAMSRFPNYSINNCILIASQCPTASLVCGYKTWQTEFNRTVNKNEHGIMIMAPVKYKADVEEPMYDENSHPILDEHGKQKTEKVKKEFQSFRPVYVFDIGQTSGDPVPSLATILDSEVDGYERLKDALISISPVPVTFEGIDGSANGYYSPATEQIVVKEGLPELQTIKTLIHEIAHAELGHGGKDDKFDRNTKEVQAESVAFWVAAMIGSGLDTSDYSFGYISGWSKDKEVSELKENLELIKSTADRISSNLEKALSRDKVQSEDNKQNVDCNQIAEDARAPGAEQSDAVAVARKRNSR